MTGAARIPGRNDWQSRSVRHGRISSSLPVMGRCLRLPVMQVKRQLESRVVLHPSRRLRVRLSGREHNCCAPSTATRLWNKAQGWTEGTTLGSGDGGALNPNGVVAGRQRRRLVFRPPGRNPVGVEEHRRAMTQGWRRANPGLCGATPLGLERRGFVLA